MKSKEITYEINFNGCYICTSHYWSNKKPLRYPNIQVLGKRQAISNYLWNLTNGPLQKGEVIRHSCDNIGCINIMHLSKGTQAENINDRDIRNHTAKGIAISNSKLSESQVLEIRKASNEGMTTRFLASIYGVDKSQISRICSRAIWKHI